MLTILSRTFRVGKHISSSARSAASTYVGAKLTELGQPFELGEIKSKKLENDQVCIKLNS